MLKDILQDIVEHIAPINGITQFRIDGTETSTEIFGSADDTDEYVSVSASLHTPLHQLIGTMGIINIPQLQIILGLKEYAEAQVEVKNVPVKYSENLLTCFNIANEDKSMEHKIPVMSKALTNKNITIHKTNTINWNITLIPSILEIIKFKVMTTSFPEESHFHMTLLEDTLTFHFGDHLMSSGKVIFAKNVEGIIPDENYWSIETVTKILGLPGDKVMCIGNNSMLIVVDSGLVSYEYLIAMSSK